MSEAWMLVDPDTGVVHLCGEYDISADRDSVGEDLRFALRADGHRTVLDRSGLRFAYGCLVDVLAAAALDGVRVSVKHPPPIVRRALDVTGVSNLIRIDSERRRRDTRTSRHTEHSSVSLDDAQAVDRVAPPQRLVEL